MAKKTKKNKKNKSRFKAFVGKILIIGVILLVGYLFILHHSITTKFDNQKWNLPSRIYSNDFPLYPGRLVNLNQIEEKLIQLGYRNVTNKPSSSGEYWINNNQLEIYLHQFEYPEEFFEGYLIIVEIENSTITRILKPFYNNQLITEESPIEELDFARLEPELISSIYDEKTEDRTFVPLEEIPEYLVQAVVSIEDKRFYSHPGVDPIGIFRAAARNLIAGKIVEGGSTLTQQLVKNYFLDSEKTFFRKFNEALMALIMDFKYSKDEIMEAYLNEIYLGQKGKISIAGVQEASRYYFSKDVNQLSLSDSAGLAGMIRSPGLYSPYRHFDDFIERKNLVLSQMLEEKVISPEEFVKAKKETKVYDKKSKTITHAPYFIEYIRREIEENYPKDILISQGLRIFSTLEMSEQRVAEKAITNHLNYLESSRDYLKEKVKNHQFLQASLVAIQPSTGYIRAYVGGRDYGKVQLDHVSQIKRQPGSSFKPFIYLTALSQNDYSLATILDDAPLSLENELGEIWEPQNYDEKFRIKVRLREALEKSYNIPSINLALKVGLDEIVETAKNAGITSDLKPYPSLALGSFEVSPLELVEAYSIFPNQGVKTKAISVLKIVTKEGEVLEKINFKMEKIFDPKPIYLANQALTGVINEGTGKAARQIGLTGLAAGKTGTTSGYRDAWFVGFSPDILALSWVGYDNNDPTELSGTSGALPIWTKFMMGSIKERNYTDFPTPNDIIKLKIDENTGLKYRRSCGKAIDEVFIKGTEPQKRCR